MRIGAHESIAGGVHLAWQRGEEDGCEALQIFTSHNTRWAPRPLGDEEASLFWSEGARLGWPVMSHGSYLVNLGSPDDELWQRSVEALILELDRCETLGLDYLVIHPGAHMGEGEDAGLARIRDGLAEALVRCPGYDVRILLENTAGQGTSLGHRFEHLGWLLDHTPGGHGLGVCIDTCHAFAAGHDLRTAEAYGETMAALDRTVGLERVLAFHLNDCKKPLGSRVDRHQHVGEGTLGLEAFRRLVGDPRFANRPATVETPAEPDGSTSFARNIATLKGLRTGP